MIKVQVFLQNEYDRHYEIVEITREEIIQLACDKAKERYFNGHWTSANAYEIKFDFDVA